MTKAWSMMTREVKTWWSAHSSKMTVDWDLENVVLHVFSHDLDTEVFERVHSNAGLIDS